jgi:predicted O-methyltransferase YrrM
VNLKRYTDNYTVNYLKFVLGMRRPATAVSETEQRFLAELARGKRCIVEVGVFEAATSRVFCREMDPAGKLYLVDPFFPEVRVERMLNVSFAQRVASRSVQPWQDRVQFIRQPSAVAAETLPLQRSADFIFIDARHDYDSVLQDFRCWEPMLAAGCVMAFHDSRPCPARTELGPDNGPVRLMREIAEGQHGSWETVGCADSVTAIRRKGGAALA